MKEKVASVLNIYNSYPHEFTETQRALLTAVANQAAICIENKVLMVQGKGIQEELQTRKLAERASGAWWDIVDSTKRKPSKEFER